MDLFKWLENNATRLSNEDIANIAELTRVKEIYSCWESNDDGEDFTLYTGLAVDGVTRRYFIKHFIRDWYGGWTYNDIYMARNFRTGLLTALCFHRKIINSRTKY